MIFFIDGILFFKQPEVNGNLDFKHAAFSYPSRPTVKVLRDMTYPVRTGQSIALVGPSGCGKSTCIQLLLRYYNLNGGELVNNKNTIAQKFRLILYFFQLLEGSNIEQMKVPQVRSKLGLVSQEPVLFDRTLAENIMYGDNGRTVSMDEVVEAAKKANIHNFVSQLPMVKIAN